MTLLTGPSRLRASSSCGGATHGRAKRHIWWNFVSSSLERIEQAKADWLSEAASTSVPGDEEEFIPLPE